MPKPATKRECYREELTALGDDPDVIGRYLTANSNLPGPRGNLELADAFADVAPAEVVDGLATTDDEYLLFCAILGLGERLAHRDDPSLVQILEQHARDPRWRVREAVAMALQRVGDHDPNRCQAIVRGWSDADEPLVLRAAIAAICEPRLLTSEAGTKAARDACQRATDWLLAQPHERRREDDVRTLRQALGYCWSVAIAADPEPGLAQFAELQASTDPDVSWIVRENLRRNRLQRVLPRTGATRGIPASG